MAEGDMEALAAVAMSEAIATAERGGGEVDFSRRVVVIETQTPLTALCDIVNYLLGTCEGRARVCQEVVVLVGPEDFSRTPLRDARDRTGASLPAAMLDGQEVETVGLHIEGLAKEPSKTPWWSKTFTDWNGFVTESCVRPLYDKSYGTFTVLPITSTRLRGLAMDCCIFAGPKAVAAMDEPGMRSMVAALLGSVRGKLIAFGDGVRSASKLLAALESHDAASSGVGASAAATNGLRLARMAAAEQ
jgi:hypothetical protein